MYDVEGGGVEGGDAGEGTRGEVVEAGDDLWDFVGCGDGTTRVDALGGVC